MLRTPCAADAEVPFLDDDLMVGIAVLSRLLDQSGLPFHGPDVFALLFMAAQSLVAPRLTHQRQSAHGGGLLGCRRLDAVEGGDPRIEGVGGGHRLASWLAARWRNNDWRQRLLHVRLMAVPVKGAEQTTHRPATHWRRAASVRAISVPEV